MNRPALFAMICALPLIAACTDTKLDTSEGQTAPQFGNAVKSNIAAQTVNPLAPADSEPLAMDGQRAALAQDRYTKGKVINRRTSASPAPRGRSGSGGGDSGGGSSGGGSSAAAVTSTAQ